MLRYPELIMLRGRVVSRPTEQPAETVARQSRNPAGIHPYSGCTACDRHPGAGMGHGRNRQDALRQYHRFARELSITGTRPGPILTALVTMAFGAEVPDL